MQRCLELAQRGAGSVAPNPMVGAVLVYENRLIGEGWHQQFGGPHAEVNCLQAVKEEDHSLIDQSTLYVSLEPCAHFGKTPPCTDRIIHHRIPKVVIGCRDPFPEVDGRGIERLRENGVEVITGILEKESTALNKRFFTFHMKHRPFIILKWAETKDGIMGRRGGERMLISNAISNRLVHRWRAEEAAIMVGTQTALADDPALTNRLWPGATPTRIVIDRHLHLPGHLQLFDGKVKTIVFNTLKQEERDALLFYQLNEEEDLLPQILKALHQLNIQSVLVEGGARLLQSFVDLDCWDEIRKIVSGREDFPAIENDNAVQAPIVPDAIPVSSERLEEDWVVVFERPSSPRPSRPPSSPPSPKGE